MTRADHDRDVLAAFGFRRLSSSGGTESHVLACVDGAQAAEVRASLMIAGVHVPHDHNRDGSTLVIAYVHNTTEST